MVSREIVRLLSVGLLLGLVMVLFVQWIGTPAQTDDLRQAEKINLALRRTAHHLLREAGDSTSRIPAIQQPNPQTYRVQLGHAFNYDKLPDLLRQSLKVHHVAGNYTVAVLDCATGELQLGYTIVDLIDKEPVPCGGRSITAGCYILQVTFDAPNPVAQPILFWPFLALGGLLTAFLFVVWQQRKRPEPQPDSSPEPTNHLRFGRSCFDVTNQTLTVEGQLYNLTYREAKLLRVLVNHANRVMDRDQILKLVWEDEGITVGRSVDVFISRLRKLMHNDPLIKIVAVHGVGYRMEVQENS